MDEEISPVSPRGINKNLIWIVIIAVAIAIIGVLIFFYFQQTFELSQLKQTNEELGQKIDEQNKQSELLTQKIEEQTQNYAELEKQVADLTKKPADLKSCVDPDSGSDYFVKGAISFKEYSTDGSIKATSNPGDICTDAIMGGEMKQNVLREYYCDENNNVQFEHYVCPNGCLSGACVR